MNRSLVSLSGHQVGLLKKSFRQLNADQVAHDFYSRLFTQYPEVKHLFPADMSDLTTKLMSVFELVVFSFEEKQRMIHVLIVGPIKETEHLLAVARIVGGIRVDNKFLGDGVLGIAMLQEPLKRGGPELVVGLLVGVILQTRERGLRGQRIGFPNDGLENGIAAQGVGVVTVLIACGDLINSLPQHLMGVMFDEDRIAPVVI